jgi:hypothetical protein
LELSQVRYWAEKLDGSLGGGIDGDLNNGNKASLFHYFNNTK